MYGSPARGPVPGQVGEESPGVTGAAGACGVQAVVGLQPSLAVLGARAAEMSLEGATQDQFICSITDMEPWTVCCSAGLTEFSEGSRSGHRSASRTPFEMGFDRLKFTQTGN